jgi:predicted dehydrogenase
MGKQVGVGFSGVGWMGEQFIRRLAARSDTELVAVHDPNRKAVKEVLRHAGVEPDCLVGSYDEIINDKKIDTVMIASPNAFHGEQSLKALGAGKHVFCEKPNSTHWRDHVQMVQADHDNPSLITVTNYTLFFNPMEQKVKRMIEQGVFGEITQIQVNYRHAVNIRGSKAWKLKKEFVGDALGMGITHAVFLLCYFLLPHRPVSVFAISQPSTTRRFEVDPIWSLNITFDSGATGIVLGDIENGNSYDVFQNIFGTHGGFVFDSQPNARPNVKYWSATSGKKWVFPLERDEGISRDHQDILWSEELSLPTSGNVVDHCTAESLDYFLNHVKQGKKARLGFEPMRIVQDINFAAQVSARKNAPVRIPAPLEELEAYLG